MSKNIITYICFILLFCHTAAFGYSFNCEKYAIPGHVQSCMQEEARYRNKCQSLQGHYNFEECMRDAHDLLERTWAQYNMPLKKNYTPKKNGGGYQPAPPKHMSSEEQYQKHIQNERYKVATRSQSYVDEIIFNYINSIPMTDPQGYKDRMIAENNYNDIMACMKNTVATKLINGNYFTNSSDIHENGLRQFVFDNYGQLLDDCIWNKYMMQ